MRINIERGYQPAIERLMDQLQTDDPKMAVHHIIGCWLISGCHRFPTPQTGPNQLSISNDAEFDLLFDDVEEVSI